MNTDYFSTDYQEARERFLRASILAGAKTLSYKVFNDTHRDLYMDISIIGRDNDPAITVSSGVHGVEGFFGSAVQLALLDSLAKKALSDNIRYILIHAVNPYGFAHIRRTNEDNIDLNRNFLEDFKQLPKTPDLYEHLNKFLNPKSPPDRDAFLLKAIWLILRYGKANISAAIAGGQHEYPQGLFFGGSKPSASAKIIFENSHEWIGNSPGIIHIDLHTGLGKRGDYKLLVLESKNSDSFGRYRKVFDSSRVQSLDDPDGVAYPAAGLFGKWMVDRFGKDKYRFAAAEFGTYPSMKVLSALRDENRAHHYGTKNDPSTQKAKSDLMEAFCPRSEKWRAKVVDTGLNIIQQAKSGLMQDKFGILSK